MLGVLTRSPSDGELSLLGRATDRFVVDNGLRGLLLVPLGGTYRRRALARLRDSTGVELESLDLGAVARSGMGRPGTGIVVLVSFGSVTEDSLRSGGGVPHRRDHGDRFGAGGGTRAITGAPLPPPEVRAYLTTWTLRQPISEFSPPPELMP
ncbi:MAG: hypothetical protein R2716_12720 [Microthrixaceae bacterium]